MTLFYVQPNNPIKVKHNRILEFFDIFCSQQWAFFSPPPQGNHKLVYELFNSDTIFLRQVEALEPIFDAKRQNAPFNTKEEILDYSLSGAIIVLTGVMREQYRSIKVNFPDSLDSFHTKEALNSVLTVSDNLPAYLTLHNYGQLIYKKLSVNDSLPENFKINFIRFKIYNSPLPEFFEREKLLSDSVSSDLELQFSSKFHPATGDYYKNY